MSEEGGSVASLLTAQHFLNRQAGWSASFHLKTDFKKDVWISNKYGFM
jgi:hypothetical protein